MSHCGHTAARRQRVYFLHDPVALYQKVVSFVHENLTTLVRDYFHATDVEVMCDAQAVARVRNIPYTGPRRLI